MEHRFGTAIGLPAVMVRANTSSIVSVTAHEFFHLWNVKRVRPKGLEPIDYVHGNDTRDLWFSEGVTSTYAALVMLRAGFETPKEFYQQIAGQITQLQERPARLEQSVEDSGRETWLERYPDYLRPQRSISYYNKGELLGFLLDLAIRQGSDEGHSLDDLLRTLNQNFAKRGRFFTDDDLRAMIATLAPHFTDIDEFFNDYIFGTKELDYNRYLGYAGLHLETKEAQRASLGFTPVRGFEGPITVESVEPGSAAEQAGLRAGDIILELNGVQLMYPPSVGYLRLKAGESVKWLVQRGRQRIEIEYKLDKVQATEYSVSEVKHATPEQLRIRKGWLAGSTESDTAAGAP